MKPMKKPFPHRAENDETIEIIVPPDTLEAPEPPFERYPPCPAERFPSGDADTDASEDAGGLSGQAGGGGIILQADTSDEKE